MTPSLSEMVNGPLCHVMKTVVEINLCRKLPGLPCFLGVGQNVPSFHDRHRTCCYRLSIRKKRCGTF